jgi:hypothetical protein
MLFRYKRRSHCSRQHPPGLGADPTADPSIRGRFGNAITDEWNLAREDCRISSDAGIGKDARAITGNLHVCDDSSLVDKWHSPKAFARHHFRPGRRPQPFYHVRQFGFHLLRCYGGAWNGWRNGCIRRIGRDGRRRCGRVCFGWRRWRSCGRRRRLRHPHSFWQDCAVRGVERESGDFFAFEQQGIFHLLFAQRRRLHPELAGRKGRGCVSDRFHRGAGASGIDWSRKFLRGWRRSGVSRSRTPLSRGDAGGRSALGPPGGAGGRGGCDSPAGGAGGGGGAGVCAWDSDGPGHSVNALTARREVRILFVFMVCFLFCYYLCESFAFVISINERRASPQKRSPVGTPSPDSSRRTFSGIAWENIHAILFASAVPKECIVRKSLLWRDMGKVPIVEFFFLCVLIGRLLALNRTLSAPSCNAKSQRRKPGSSDVSIVRNTDGNCLGIIH